MAPAPNFTPDMVGLKDGWKVGTNGHQTTLENDPDMLRREPYEKSQRMR